MGDAGVLHPAGMRWPRRSWQQFSVKYPSNAFMVSNRAA
jgi:hypothetical protein